MIAGPGALPRVSGEEPTAPAYLLAWDPVAQKERWRVNFTGAGSGSGTLATARHARLPGRSPGRAGGVSRGHGRTALAASGRHRRGHAVTYAIDGRQYVAIAGGRGGDDPTRVTAFALPAP